MRWHINDSHFRGKLTVGILQPDTLLKCEGVTLVLKAQPDRKIRVTSTSWPEPIVILQGQALEVVHDGVALRVNRKLAPSPKKQPYRSRQLRQA